MRSHTRLLLAFALGAALAAPALAADHGEAPLTKADLAADIADVYAWHEGDKLYAAITYDGIKPPVAGQKGTFDTGVLYTLHIDNDGDFVSDIEVKARYFRFGSFTGVLVSGLPGGLPFLLGPVERVVRFGNVKFFAGLRDDPFFFDLEGFRQTLQTGTLAFNGQRDTFAGKNATSLVLQMDLSRALRGGKKLNIWATTARQG